MAGYCGGGLEAGGFIVAASLEQDAGAQNQRNTYQQSD